MPNPVVGMIGASVGGAAIQANAAKKAAGAQVAAADMSVEEQRRQFDATQEVLAPYVNAGVTAMQGLVPYAEAGVQGLQGQLALSGLAGPEAQRAAIQQIEQGPEFQALTQAGEEAILQQASATGGLRGGNTQSALAQFRPQVLSSLINQQYGRLGGFTSLGQTTTQNVAQLGQAAAARQASAGQQTAANIGNLYNQMGAAQAGASLGQGQAWGNMFGGIGQISGAIASGAIDNPFGVSTRTLPAGVAPTTSLRPMLRPGG